MNSNLVRKSAATVMAALALTSMASAQNAFAVSRDGAYIDVIDISTGAQISSTSIMAPVIACNGMAMDPTTGILYIIANTGGSTRELMTLDPVTGAVALMGNTGDQFNGLAFTSAGVLYACTGDGASTTETLYTMDTATGAPTFVMFMGNGNDGDTIGYCPADGYLYHASGYTTGSHIFEKINLATLAITVIPESGDLYDEMTSMTWTGTDFVIGTIFPGDLRRIDTNGVVTTVGGSTNGVYRGLAMDTGASDCTSFCSSTPNSSGGAAIISSTDGCDSDGDGIIDVEAGPVPNQPGIFFSGTSQLGGGAGIPFGNGLLCTAGVITRHGVVFGVGNVASMTIDISGLSSPAYMQYWFRDPAAGGAFFDTSDAMITIP